MQVTQGVTTARVLVVSANTVFDSAIVSWLLTTTNLEIQTVSPQERNLLQVIRRFQPQVIVLDEDMYRHNLYRLLRCFLPCAEIRLVSVNPKNGFVHVYDIRQIHIEHISDFSALVFGT